jgi:chromosome partitioning protein
MPPARSLDELHSKLESATRSTSCAMRWTNWPTDYDQIWIDTPPALNFYTRSALIAAQGCLIPFDCDDFSRRALYGLMENVQEIQADHNAGAGWKASSSTSSSRAPACRSARCRS